MESHLSLLLIVCSGIWFLKSREDDSAEVMISFGVVLGLMILARLDDLFYAGAALGFVSVGGSFRKSVGRALISGTAVCALIVPYLVFNYTKFGHIEPISGAIKGSFPQITGSLENLGRLGQTCAVIALLGLALSFTDVLTDSVKALIRAICTGVLLQSAYTVMFTHDPSTASYWYYVLGIVGIALVVDATVVAVSKRGTPAFRNILGYATRVAAVVILGGGLARGWLESAGLNVNPLNTFAVARLRNPDGLRFQRSLANWMNANIPEGSTVLVVDFPGRLAFQTNFRIVPLDGLVSDYDYNDEIVKRGISRFIARNDIKYYLGPIVRPGQTIGYSYYLRAVGQPDAELMEVVSPLYRKPAGTFEVKRADLLLDVNEAFGTTEGHGHLGLWRTSPSEAENVGAD